MIAYLTRLVEQRKQIREFDERIEYLTQTYFDIIKASDISKLSRERAEKLEKELEIFESDMEIKAEELRATLIANKKVLTFKEFVRRYYELEALDKLYRRLPCIRALSNPQ